MVLALALPAFAQEELTCYDRNGDGTYRCGGKLFGPLNEAYDVNDEYPTPWDIGDEGYGYPWDIGDESDDTPPWDMGDESDGDPRGTTATPRWGQVMSTATRSPSPTTRSYVRTYRKAT